jgi:hypothetical protein
MSKLQELHDLLRDETKWPDGFKWDYALNSKCALGLAIDTGLISWSEMRQPAAFGLDQSDWDHIFNTPWGGRGESREDSYTKVRPRTVALRIRRHLKAQAL